MKEKVNWRPRLDRTLSTTVFVVSLAIFLWATTRGWNEKVFLGHGYLQVFNAIGAESMARSGPALAFETPSVGSPWAVHTEFPLFHAAVAATSRMAGWDIAPSGRAVSLGSFLLSLPACFLILGTLGLPWHRRLVVLAVVVATPIYLFYSRALLSEGVAFALSVWFLAAYIRFATQLGIGWGAAASVLGACAAAVKFTTLAVFLIPALFIGFARFLKSESGGRVGSAWDIRDLALLAIPIAASLVAPAVWLTASAQAWNLHPSAEWLIPADLATSGFGTLAQRADAEFWLRVGEHMLSSTLPPFGVALCGVLAFTGDGRHRRTIAMCVLFFVFGPLLFAGRFFAHDYFYYGGAVFPAAALGLGLIHVLDERRIQFAARWSIVVAALVGQWLGYWSTYRPLISGADSDSRTRSRIIEQATDNAEVSLVIGDKWDLSIPYYAHRRTLTISPRSNGEMSWLTRALESLKPGEPALLIVPGDLHFNNDLVPPLALRLGMEPRPILQINRTSVFMRRDRESDFKERLRASGKFKFVAMLEEPMIFSMMSPKPFRVEAEYDINSFESGHGASLFAHAPTDLFFEIPENATRVTLEFGMLLGSYTGSGDSDGVEFAVVLRENSSTDRLLFSKFLNPVHHEPDRHPVRAVVELPPNADGELIVRTLPGPLKRNNFDWGYWRLVEIR